MTLREDVYYLMLAARSPVDEEDAEYYTDQMLKIFIEKIDIKLRNVESEESEYWRGYIEALRELKQDLK